MAEVYKVVQGPGPRVYSSGFISGKLALKYRVGEWTKPEFGKIFAFNNYKDARFFRDSVCSTDGVIFRAEAVISRSKVHLIVFVGSYESRSSYWKGRFRKWLIAWWKDRSFVPRFGIGTPVSQTAPGGTVLCDRLKLIREV